MPDLQSPVVPIAALALAGNSERGRQFTGGESGMNLVAAGFGGASAEYVGDQVTSLVGMKDTMTNELGQALAGAAVSQWGDPVPRNKALARGVHYNVMTQSFQDVGLSLGELVNGDLLNGGGSTAGTTQTTQTTQTTTNTAGSEVTF